MTDTTLAVMAVALVGFVLLSIVNSCAFANDKSTVSGAGGAAGAFVAAKDVRLKDLVSNLGAIHRDLSVDFDLVATKPHAAVPMLVKELHSIERRTYFETSQTVQSRHVFACLRALRYLTGQTFSAASSQKLTDDEKQFLDFKKEMHDLNPGHQIHFFGVWMSRNAEYAAPEDAQIKIIKQWKTWSDKYGKTFQHSPPKAKECMDDWFWFG